MAAPHRPSRTRLSRLATVTLGAALVAVPAAALAVPALSASAAGVGTCRGETATIVGTPGKRVTGTEARDVVVTNDADRVDTLGGDDLVCITGRTPPGGGYHSIDVTTGPGADVVDGAGAAGWAANLVLGAGADQFHGGPHEDQVNAGTPGPGNRPTVDGEADTIVTGAGRDTVVSGDESGPNLDVVDTGPDDDAVTWRGRGAATVGRVVAGEGRDVFSTLADGGLRLDNVAGRATHDGGDVATWSDLEVFHLTLEGTVPSPIDVLGGPAEETVEVYSHDDRASGPVRVELGAGDDAYRSDAPGAAGSAYAGGPGRDHLVIGSHDHPLDLDLREGRLEVGGAVSPATEFEVAYMLARTVTVRGTDGDDSLITSGCRQVIRGRGGDDFLASYYDGYFEQFNLDCTQRARVLGGGGRDTLRGSTGPDRLVGGSGRDRAQGRSGRDLCRAERVRSCERR